MIEVFGQYFFFHFFNNFENVGFTIIVSICSHTQIDLPLIGVCIKENSCAEDGIDWSLNNIIKYVLLNYNHSVQWRIDLLFAWERSDCINIIDYIKVIGSKFILLKLT